MLGLRHSKFGFCTNERDVCFVYGTRKMVASSRAMQYNFHIGSSSTVGVTAEIRRPMLFAGLRRQSGAAVCSRLCRRWTGANPSRDHRGQGAVGIVSGVPAVPFPAELKIRMAESKSSRRAVFAADTHT